MQVMRRLTVLILLASALAAPAARASASPPDGARFWEPSEARARFALRHGEGSSRLRVALATVLPRGKLELSALDRAGAPVAVEVTGARGLTRNAGGSWTLTAPARPGLLHLRVASADAQDEVALVVFVLVPRARVARGRLNGYEIGNYPPPSIVQGSLMTPPAGFIEATEANADTPVSPHFRLGQFLCKQDGGFPKYLLLDPLLVAKLEALLDALRQRGIAADSLEIMSGYRTPWYNRKLGNKTSFSRHLWGQAADVFVDRAPRDGRMDDLDGNGVSDARDSAFLFAIADELDRAPPEDWRVGGASSYDSTESHGPFLHVDVRGRAARW
ncbi:MAG TPA: D-Ala-D-Ala carboxypeptidase family metallohydrolase [Myxococcota bacterium]|nr:D-Ala-D-Ala carboxypeptidase family metallohydrolase [Myxococcota bacterium]